VDSGDAGVLFDATDEPTEWKGEVPSCTPRPPDGREVVAVVGGELGKVGDCPAGYEPTGTSGFGDVIDQAFECTPGSCTCGPYVPNDDDCPMRLGYFADSDCTTELSSTPLSTACSPIDQAGPPYGKVLASTQPPPCPLSGDAGIVKQAARVGLEIKVCRSAGPPSGEGCIGSDLPKTPAKNAVACYISPSASCAAPYSTATAFWADKALVDDRACDCDCHHVDAGCVGGQIAAYYNGYPCTVAPNRTFGLGGGCAPIVGYFDFYEIVTQAATLADAGCILETKPHGAVGLTGEPSFLCCLTPCDSCGRATASPGGACASLVQACLSDAECKDYLSCAQSTGCSSASCSGCGDAGATPARYSDLMACRASACRAECP
jgi:hypothetical protein